MSTHDWRNYETCECGELGCRSSRANAAFRAYIESLPEQECADRSAARREPSRLRCEGCGRQSFICPGCSDLEIDVANWKRRYEETQELLHRGSATWEVTIRDRDEQKARADKAEAAIARVNKVLKLADDANRTMVTVDLVAIAVKGLD